MLDLAMPEADIQVTPMNGMVLLTGTVAQPADAAEAERLVQAFVGEGTQVVSRLRTATPQQVMLQVRIAEVNRTLVREVGINLLTPRQDRRLPVRPRPRQPGTIADRVRTLTDPVTGHAAVIGTDFHVQHRARHADDARRRRAPARPRPCSARSTSARITAWSPRWPSRP